MPAGNELKQPLADRRRTPLADWTIYAADDPPRSAVGGLLSSALFHQVVLNNGFGPDDIASLGRPGDEVDGVRRAVTTAIALFQPPLLDGRFPTYARPVGGGPTVAIPPWHWELDNLLPRFAASAYAFDAPFDSEARPTHWIFADAAVEVAIYDLHRPPELATAGGRSDETVAGEPNGGAEEVGAGAGSSARFLRLPQVEALVGIKKSEIYERMGRGEFPANRPIGRGRARGWREADILAWLSNPR